MAFKPTIVNVGTFKVGATDYSAEVTSVDISMKRDTVELPATFATGRKEQRAGSIVQDVTINFLHDPQTTSLYSALYTALLTADATVTFSVNELPGTNSPTNPNYSGSFVVTEIHFGGKSGELSQWSATFPVVGAITVATS